MEQSAAMKSAKKAITAAASIAASAMLARSLVNEFLPYELRSYLSIAAGSLFAHLSAQHTIVIEETEGFSANLVYDAVKIYLAARISTSMRRLKVSKIADEKKNITISLEQGEEMIDFFEGIEFKWQLHCREEQRSSFNSNQRNASMPPEFHLFELSFHKKYKEKALNSYLPFIVDHYQAIKAEDRQLKLYMNEGDYWNPVNLHHPSTFDTLAMDSEIKQAVMEDLAMFVKRRDYYKRIGKAWKRGYLLYGPPGTGKSSLVAAMANYLKFDIYDLELTEVSWNTTLRRLLVAMSNKSLLVVEDIDCSIDLQHREDESGPPDGEGRGNEKVTLSGLLNFVDGLWSTCGEERIIVFTTNFKDRLDPALLRPGRMDMHIHMGYCGASGFRKLVSNYHDVNEHPLFGDIEGLVGEVEVTPAEIAEELMRSEDKEIALRGLIKFLDGKRRGSVEADESKENRDAKNPHGCRSPRESDPNGTGMGTHLDKWMQGQGQNVPRLYKRGGYGFRGRRPAARYICN